MTRSPLPPVNGQSTSGQPVEALLTSLAQSHEQIARLAHENGALSDRSAGLVRELQEARDSVVSDQPADTREDTQATGNGGGRERGADADAG
jgi:hypothetical protein